MPRRIIFWPQGPRREIAWDLPRLISRLASSARRDLLANRRDGVFKKNLNNYGQKNYFMDLRRRCSSWRQRAIPDYRQFNCLLLNLRINYLLSRHLCGNFRLASLPDGRNLHGPRLRSMTGFSPPITRFRWSKIILACCHLKASDWRASRRPLQLRARSFITFARRSAARLITSIASD